MKNWYIVQTFSGFEQKVAETINKTVEKQELKDNEAKYIPGDYKDTIIPKELIKICDIPCNTNVGINISLPPEKLNLIPLNKALITIHLSDKWINKFYNEENFLDLILQLPKKNYMYVLTTDNSTQNKFKKIYNY